MCLRSFFVVVPRIFALALECTHIAYSMLDFISFSRSLARLLQAIAFNSLHALADATLYLDTYMQLTVALNNFHL